MRRSASLLFGALALACALSGTTWQPARGQESDPFSTSDLNKDGIVDREEYQRRMVEVFYFADRDKDGFVTVEELRAIGPVNPQAFRAADKNGDGKLTVDEFVVFRMVDFDQADTNKDGKLTKEEEQAWTASHR